MEEEEITQPTPGGGEPLPHSDLISYMHSKNMDIKQDELRGMVLGDPEMFDFALQGAYNSNVAPNSDMDYQTFKAMYLDANGDPFADPDHELIQPGSTSLFGPARQGFDQDPMFGAVEVPFDDEGNPNVTPAGGNPTEGYAWGPKPLTGIVENTEYATSVTNPQMTVKDMPDSVKKAHARIDQSIARSALDRRRDGDWTTPGDDHAIATAQNGEYLSARLKNRNDAEIMGRNTNEQLRAYNFRLGGIAEEMHNLGLAVEGTREDLVEKYGETIFTPPEGMTIGMMDNYNELITEVKQDPLYQEYSNYLSLYKANHEKLKELGSDPKFSKAHDFVEAQIGSQQLVDEYGNNLYNVPGLLKAGGKLMKAGYAISDAIEVLVTGDDVYSRTDAVQDWFLDWGNRLEMMLPSPSNMTRSPFTTTGVYNHNGTNYQIDFSEDGEIEAIRDAKGMLTKDKLPDSVMEEMKGVKKSRQFNPNSFIHQSTEVGIDMMVQLALAKGIGSGLTTAGIKAGLAQQAGLVMGTAGMMVGPMYEQAVDEWGQGNDAALYALAASLGIGFGSLLVGTESRLLGGPKGYLDDVLTKSRNAKVLATGKATPWQKASYVSGKVLSLGAGEMGEEVIVENLIDAGARMIVGRNSEEIKTNDLLNTATISFAVGVLGNAPEINSNVYQSALYTAVQNPEKYAQQYRELIEKGVIEFVSPTGEANYEEELSKHVSGQEDRMKDLGRALRGVRPHIPANISEESILGILDQRRELEAQKEAMGNAALPDAIQHYDDQIADVNKQLMQMMGLPVQMDTAKTEEGAIIEVEPETTPPPPNVQTTIDNARSPDRTVPAAPSESRTLYNPERIEPPSLAAAANHRASYQNSRGYVRYDPENEEYHFVRDDGSSRLLTSDGSVTPASVGLRVSSRPTELTYNGRNDVQIGDNNYEYVNPVTNDEGEIVGAVLRDSDGNLHTTRDTNLANRLESFAQRGEDLPDPAIPPAPEPEAPPLEATPSQQMDQAIDDRLDNPIEEQEMQTISQSQLPPNPPNPPAPPGAIEDPDGPTSPERPPTDPRRQIIGQLQEELDALIAYGREQANVFAQIEDSVRDNPQYTPVEGQSPEEAIQKEIGYRRKQLQIELNRISEQIVHYQNLIENVNKAGANDLSEYLEILSETSRNFESPAYSRLIRPEAVEPSSPARRFLTRPAHALYLVGASINRLLPKTIRRKKGWLMLCNALYKHSYANLATPKSVTRNKQRTIDRINGHMARGTGYINRIKSILKSHGGLTEGRDLMLNRALASPSLMDPSRTDLADVYPFTGNPETDQEIIEIVRQMKAMTKALSEDLIIMGVSDGELTVTISGNLDLYVHRSYQVHDNPDWIEEVQTRPAFNTATNFIYQQAQQRYNELAELRDRAQELVEEHQSAVQEAEANAAQSGEPLTTDTLQHQSAILYNQKRIESLQADMNAEAAKMADPAAQAIALLKQQQQKAGQSDDSQPGPGRKPLAKDLGATKALKDIDEPIRMLYGEYTSGVVNFMKTIQNQAQLLEAHRNLTDLAYKGMGTIFFSTPPPGGNFTELISAEGSQTMAPLNGLYTTPEIKFMLDNLGKNSEAGWLMSNIAAAISFVKKGKTVYNPTSQVRNLTSGGLFHMSSGDFAGTLIGAGSWLSGLSKSIPGLRGVVESLGATMGESGIFANAQRASSAAFNFGVRGESTTITPEAYAELVSLGLSDESVSFGDSKSIVDSFQKGELAPEDVPGWLQRRKSAFYAADGTDLPTAYYQACDNYHRMYRYYDDLARYGAAYGYPMEELVQPGTHMAFKEKIAEMAKNNYPTYSRVPDFYQAIGRLPVIAPFSSFAAEQVRVLYNSGHQGIMDIREGMALNNRALQKIGYKRLVGVAATLGGLKFAAAGATVLISQLFSMFSDEEDRGKHYKVIDHEERKMWQNFLPDWVENGMFGIFNHDGATFNFIDYTPVIPNVDWANLTHGIARAIAYQDLELLDNSWRQIVKPFTTWDLFSRAVMEGVTNTRELGKVRRISNPQDHPFSQVAHRVGHVLWESAPGWLSSTAYRIGIASIDNLGGNADFMRIRPSHQYKLGVEISANLTGVRMSEGNIETSFKYRIRDLSLDYKDALDLYRDKARSAMRRAENRDEKISTKERMEMYSGAHDRAERQASKALQEAIDMYAAAQQLGVPSKVLDPYFKGYFSSEQVKGIKRGKIVLPEIDNLGSGGKKKSKRSRRTGRSKGRSTGR